MAENLALRSWQRQKVSLNKVGSSVYFLLPQIRPVQGGVGWGGGGGGFGGSERRLNALRVNVSIEFCKKCKQEKHLYLIHMDMLVFSAVRNVKVFLLGATIHGLAGLRALKTANWRLWRTRNWEMTPFSESPSTVHLLRPTMASAMNTTYSLEDVTALNQLPLKPFCILRIMLVHKIGIQFPLNWADFVMPRLKANCYLEIFKFQFISNSLVRVVMHTLVLEV